jgi:signal transduction histidine kinase
MRALLGPGAQGSPIGKPLQELLVDTNDWTLWQRVLTTNANASLTTRFRCANGSILVLRGDVRKAPLHAHVGDVICGVFVDCSDEEQLQAAVQQSARMEALGSLTAGIAHDFNNLLTVLVGNLYLIAEDVRDNPKLFEKLKSARDAGKRGADLIKQLLAFARREHIEADVIDPCRIVGDLVPLLRRALGNRISLDTELASSALLVRASTAQLESVIVNLAINARDAIEKKGRVLIRVAALHFSAAEVAQRGLVNAGTYVVLGVADNGCGIPPEAIGRIFEPFFSTKRDRGGTGLGLSMVRWFAEANGGSVHVDSAVGSGTTVTLMLPLVTDRPIEANDRTMPLSTLPSGTETVLVLAAEEGLRATIRQILEVLGYSVRFTAEVEETLAITRGERIDLLIIDGGMRNEAAQTDFLAQLGRAAPNVKLIVADDSAGSKERWAGPDAAILLKPFSLADLANTVRQTLDGQRDGQRRT